MVRCCGAHTAVHSVLRCWDGRLSPPSFCPFLLSPLLMLCMLKLWLCGCQKTVPSPSQASVDAQRSDSRQFQGRTENRGSSSARTVICRRCWFRFCCLWVCSVALLVSMANVSVQCSPGPAPFKHYWMFRVITFNQNKFHRGQTWCRVFL